MTYNARRTHTDSSVGNMLASTFSVGNSSVVVMCMFSTNSWQHFCGHLAVWKISSPTVGRWVVSPSMCRQTNCWRLTVGMCMAGLRRKIKIIKDHLYTIRSYPALSRHTATCLSCIISTYCYMLILHYLDILLHAYPALSLHTATCLPSRC